MAVPAELCAGREPAAEADRADEPRRSVLRARCDGRQIIDIGSGRVTATYNLYNNETRVVAFDANKGHPEDAKYQAPDARIPPQIHY
jgi:hypothetical protein